jgi:hypothetical protein
VRDQSSQARTIALIEISDHRRHFDEFRRQYFFIEEFPENDARFATTFEECQEDLASAST